VVSFYSYKGGVGRSFIVANVGAALAAWGYRVLCVDWDLEAPGLSYYLEKWLPPPRRGLLEMIEGFAEGRRPRWRSIVQQAKVAGVADRLHLIRAGNPNSTFMRRVQSINWRFLYGRRDLGRFLEDTRESWKAEYDCVLIDSRTGITDIGGICTSQMPDVLAIVTVANQQSLDGVMEVARRAVAGRRQLPYSRGAMMVFPILSRFDAEEEYVRARRWRRTIARHFGEWYRWWVWSGVPAGRMVDFTTVPYFPYWSFGEGLPVVEERSIKSGNYISYSLESIAALIALRFQDTLEFVREREAYLGRARRLGQRSSPSGNGYRFDVFLGYGGENRKFAKELENALSSRRLAVVSGTDVPLGFDGRMGAAREAFEHSRNLVVVISDHTPDSVLDMVVWFLKNSANERADRRILPVYMNKSAVAKAPSFLRQFNAVFADEDSTANIAQNIASVLDASKET
jgi:hypothetical protein